MIYYVVADNYLPAEATDNECFTQTSASLEISIRMNQHSPNKGELISHLLWKLKQNKESAFCNLWLYLLTIAWFFVYYLGWKLIKTFHFFFLSLEQLQ